MPLQLAQPINLEEIAEEAVNAARGAFPLGSSNINRNAFNPRKGMFQYMPAIQHRFRKSLGQAEAVILVRNEDVRDLPGVYKYEKQMQCFDALVDNPIKQLAAERVLKAQARYVAANMLAAAVAKKDGRNQELLAMRYRLNRAREQQAGNCNEMADFVFQHIYDSYYGRGLHAIKPEILSFYRVGVVDTSLFDGSGDIYNTSIDHACAAIRRTSDSEDWRNWNHDTIIIDPWIGRWFYVTELYKENPWPFHVPTQDIRFKTCMCIKDQASTGAEPAAAGKSRFLSF